LPQVPQFNIEAYIKHFNAKIVKEGFNYSSGENTEWETVESLRQQIREYVDESFEEVD
jgi:hypothetical protein